MCFLCFLWAHQPKLQPLKTTKDKLLPRDWLARLQHRSVNIMQRTRYGAESGISQLLWGIGWLNPIRVAVRFGNLALPGRLWRRLSRKLKPKSCMKQETSLLPQEWVLLIAIAVAELDAVEGSPGTTLAILYKDIREYSEKLGEFQALSEDSIKVLKICPNLYRQIS